MAVGRGVGVQSHLPPAQRPPTIDSSPTVSRKWAGCSIAGIFGFSSQIEYDAIHLERLDRLPRITVGEAGGAAVALVLLLDEPL